MRLLLGGAGGLKLLRFVATVVVDGKCGLCCVRLRGAAVKHAIPRSHPTLTLSRLVVGCLWRCCCLLAGGLLAVSWLVGRQILQGGLSARGPRYIESFNKGIFQR